MIHAPIIDCDVHNIPPSVESLFPFLATHWREYISQSAFKGPLDAYYPSRMPITARPETKSPAGGPPGSDLAVIQTQVLDAWGCEYAILNCLYAVDSVHNPDAAVALASAVNDWQVAEWLEKEPRLRASIVVPIQHPELAAREIDRVGDHAGFVQVLLPVHSEAPYGNRRYHPVYAAAARHDLAVGIHFGGAPGAPPTPCGWPSTFIEEYVDMAGIFQSQLLSIIVEGVLDKFPTTRLALIESGVTWLPGWMWRIDKEWKGLRREVPWNKQLPSEYIRQHLRLTTQPLDAPPQPEYLAEIIDQIGSDELLMFATDYPHRHFETADEAFPLPLPEGPARKVLAANAQTFYRLEAGSPQGGSP